jgi:dienelactone hydrolase
MTSIHRRAAAGITVAALATAVALVGTASAEQATGGPDPTAPGRHAVATAEYALGDTAFRRDGFTVELTGAVHYPADLGGRTHPLILIEHGLFETCDDPQAGPAYAAARESLHGSSPTQDPAERARLEQVMGEAHPKLTGWPCSPGVEPIRSYRGYDYLGRHLAGHGFVVVSVSANGANAGSSEPGANDYTVRAALLNEHLRLWQQLARSGDGPLAGTLLDPSGSPATVDFRNRVDLGNVGTLGHSRGGRAVMHHAADEQRDAWPAGVQIKAVVPMEPVPSGGEDVTTVPFATVIGACDWVSNPAARDYLDRVRGRNTTPLHQWTVHGANHNFFNSQWSPDGESVLGYDDAHVSAFGEPNPPGRCRTTDSAQREEPQLTEDRQRTLGLGYVSAFFRRYLTGDKAFDGMLAGTQHPLSAVGAVDVERVEPAR